VVLIHPRILSRTRDLLIIRTYRTTYTGPEPTRSCGFGNLAHLADWLAHSFRGICGRHKHGIIVLLTYVSYGTHAAELKPDTLIKMAIPIQKVPGFNSAASVQYKVEEKEKKKGEGHWPLCVLCFGSGNHGILCRYHTSIWVRTWLFGSVIGGRVSDHDKFITFNNSMW